ncbi:MAG: LemA family protein [Candidatus Tenebribacter davisii]|jgi:LemA protein|nr:LemA family protein [Candidatus Tenebribacter davisii]
MSKNAKTGCLIAIAVVVVLIIIMISSIIGNYNKMVTLDEGVKEKWSQVENVYQRRYDLIPNLVNTVKGYAAHEKETFTAVTEARAKAGGTFNISEKVLNDPAMFQKFQQAQSSLGGALQRLMVVMEKYPDLKANQNFLALQDQLEGTENRIAVERKRFNEAARNYNTYIKIFPKVIIANMFGFDEKQYFKSTEGAEEAPKVEF